MDGNGKRGIRTLGTKIRTTDQQSDALVHSAISPQLKYIYLYYVYVTLHKQTKQKVGLEKRLFYLYLISLFFFSILFVMDLISIHYYNNRTLHIYIIIIHILFIYIYILYIEYHISIYSHSIFLQFLLIQPEPGQCPAGLWGCSHESWITMIFLNVFDLKKKKMKYLLFKHDQT